MVPEKRAVFSCKQRKGQSFSSASSRRVGGWSRTPATTAPAAESHLTQRLFGAMLRRIWALRCQPADGQWRQEIISGEEQAQRGRSVGAQWAVGGFGGRNVGSRTLRHEVRPRRREYSTWRGRAGVGCGHSSEAKSESRCASERRAALALRGVAGSVSRWRLVRSILQEQRSESRNENHRRPP